MSPSLNLKYILLIYLYTLFYLTQIISMSKSQERNVTESFELKEKLVTKPKSEQESKQKARPKGVNLARGLKFKQKFEIKIDSKAEKEDKRGKLEKVVQKAKQKIKQKVIQKAKGNAKRKCGFTENSDRIVGGHIAKENTYPWLGALNVNGRFHCSVNIIDEWWVLTAAHAFLGFDKNNLSMLSIGVGNIERTKGTIYGVSKIIADTYDPETKQRDIALMKIKGPIKFNKRIMPICLPRKNDPQPKKGEVLKVAGWGYEKFKSGKAVNKLKEVELTLISNEKCAEIYEEIGMTITKSQLCTYNVRKDACQGDSGGPAIKLIGGFATLVGLISFGRTCADSYPGVYTKVSYYMKWINKVIKSNK